MIKFGAVAPRILSCDVFDTLLQRNGIAEPNRVRRVAKRAADMLAQERGVIIDSDALWRARMDVQRYAYRALDMLHPSGEVRFAPMIEGMATVLGLGMADADVLIRAEIAVERTQLAPNVPLLDWAARCAAQGIRVIAISDTWHDAATIRQLLDAVAPRHPVAQVYTSADLDATKRSARIFSAVAAHEGAAAGEFFHIGDDELADERMPRREGWRAHRIARHKWTMLRRRVDGARARARGVAHQ